MENILPQQHPPAGQIPEDRSVSRPASTFAATSSAPTSAFRQPESAPDARSSMAHRVEHHDAGPSMAVEISAARAHRENDRVSVTLFSKNETKKRLTTLKTTIAAKNFCGPCWIDNRQHIHLDNECNGVAKGWTWSGSMYRSWKGRLDFPDYHCYNCALPQVLILPIDQLTILTVISASPVTRIT
jgi:hypothetical protein